MKKYILEHYNTTADHPWKEYPRYEVFRHSSNQKWFALIMDVPGEKLGLSESNRVDIVNLKCDPVLIASLCRDPGFFPAYHMNKANWISIRLGECVPDTQIKLLLEMSFHMTA